MGYPVRAAARAVASPPALTIGYEAFSSRQRRKGEDCVEIQGELSDGWTTRRVNGGALWNVASLVNVLTALFLFLLPTVDQYYVSHQHWLLPFCLLCTKLLLAQSFKLLAASASLTSSGWQLLTSLEEMQASRFNSKSSSLTY